MPRGFDFPFREVNCAMGLRPYHAFQHLSARVSIRCSSPMFRVCFLYKPLMSSSIKFCLFGHDVFVSGCAFTTLCTRLLRIPDNVWFRYDSGETQQTL
eukprot:scaffold16470_cov21-Prasinocladus_malaysianus.AAC.1